MKITTKLLLSGALTLAGIFATSNASATVLMEDNFASYANGLQITPSGWPSPGGGGTGWSYNWWYAGNMTATAQTPGLTYPAGVGYTATNGMLHCVSGGFFEKIQRGNTSSGATMKAGSPGVRYLSFLVKYENNLTAYTEHGLYNDNGGTGFFVGANGTMMMEGAGPKSDSGVPAQLNTTYLWVLKLVSDGTTIHAYANFYGPSDTVPATEPTTWVMSSSAPAMDINNFGGYSGPSTYDLDEVVVADTYYSALGLTYVPTVSSVARAFQTTPAVTFATDLNHNFLVQAAASSAGPWTTVQSVPGDGNNHTYILPVGTSYKVLQVLSHN